MALLALLRDYLSPDNLLAAHLDHCLRPSSEAEAKKAKEAAEHLGLECCVEKREVKLLAQQRGKGLEEAARFARYEFLERQLDDWGGHWLLTAHQAQDQAETIVLKLARGSGPGGLMGIPAQRGRIIRPLLSFERGELLEFLKSRSLSWLEDESNQEIKFSRNLVRHRVLPQFERLNPAYLAALSRVARLAADEELFWDNTVSRLSRSLTQRLEPCLIKLEAAGFMALSLAEQRRLVGRLLRDILSPKADGGEPISLLSVDMVLDLAQRPGAGGLDLPGGRRVEWGQGNLYFGLCSRFKSIFS
jgi:tRNA(Ile)-lysidine synthase